MIQCFEVDFNNPNPFTAIHLRTEEGDWERMDIDELPKVGDQVFIYCSEYISVMPGHYDVGFGFLATVSKSYSSPHTENCHILHFEIDNEL